MKSKILIFFLLLFSTGISAQFVRQSLGGPPGVESFVRGAISADSGVATLSFPDTATANRGPNIKKRDGLQIKVGTNFYIRHAALSKWILIGGTSTTTPIIFYGIDSVTLNNNILCQWSGGISTCYIITTTGDTTITGIDSVTVFGDVLCQWKAGTPTCYQVTNTIINNSQFITIIDSTINQTIINNFGIDSSTRLISGSVVIDSGFVGHSTALYYKILGRFYNAPYTPFTITGSNPSADRYTIVYADTLGNVGTIDGAYGSPAPIPQVDAESQILLAIYFIPASSTTPQGVSSIWVYREAVEWDLLRRTTTTGFDSAYLINPYAGLRSLRLSSQIAGQYYEVTDGLSHDAADFTMLDFYLRLNATFNKNTKWGITFYKDSSLVTSNTVVLQDAQFGYNRTVSGTYQAIAIPFSQWNFTSPIFNKIRVTAIGNGSIPYQVDDIKLQAGGGNVGGGGNFVETVNGLPGPHVNIAKVDTGYVNADTSLYQFVDKRTGTILFSLPSYVNYFTPKDTCTTIDSVGIRTFAIGTNPNCFANKTAYVNATVYGSEVHLYRANGDSTVLTISGGGGSGGLSQLGTSTDLDSPNDSTYNLKTVNGNVGTFGSASKTVTTTVNGKGLTTAISEQNIAIAESQVTNLVSDLTLKLPISDTAAMLSPYKTSYPRQAVSLVFTTTGSSGAATGTYNNGTGVFTFNVPQYSGGGAALDSTRKKGQYLDSVVNYVGPTGTFAYFKEQFFNVKDYRPVGYVQGVSDATGMIQAAINACVAAGGGTVYIPYDTNTYKISGALQTSVSGVNPNCQIPFPLVTQSSKPITIKFLGGTMTHTLSSNSGGLNTQGVILESTITGTGEAPSVIGAAWANYTPFGNRTWINVQFENITVRTNTKSGGTDIAGTMSGINGSKFMGMQTKNVKIDITSTNAATVQPTNETFGIIFPAGNNTAALTSEGFLLIGGYKYGIVLEEHLVAQDIFVYNCVNGMVTDYGYHSANILKFNAEGCINNILQRGSLDVFISAMQTEHYLSGWNTFQYDTYKEAIPSSVLTTTDTAVMSGTKVRNIHIAHFHQATPSVGVQNLFVTNDSSKVFVSKINDIDLVETIQTPSSSATHNINLLNGSRVYITLTSGSGTIINFYNSFIGKEVTLFLKQDATGSRQVTIQGTGYEVFSDPNAFTTIKGINTASGWVFSTDAESWRVNGNNSNPATYKLGTLSNNSLRFITNNTEKMVIDSVGNVGIGTTSATNDLLVKKSKGSSGAVTVYSENASTAGEAALGVRTTTGSVNLELFGSTFSGPANKTLFASSSAITDFRLGTFGANPINIATGMATGQDSSKLYIGGSGVKIGIGTTSPSEALEVSAASGAIRVSNTSTSGTNLSIFCSDALGPLMRSHTDRNGLSTANFASVSNLFGGNGYIVTTSPATTAGVSRTFTDRFRVSIAGGVSIGSAYTGTDAGANNMIISGNIGIGQTSPTSRLHLPAGTATASTAPLKFTSGTNLTTIENGAVEYNGSRAFLSSNGTRQDFHQGVSGSFSQVGTATTTFTVTFGGTQPNATYQVLVTPTAALSAALFYVTNKTTTTFDVTYLAGLTGTVTFDWTLIQ